MIDLSNISADETIIVANNRQELFISSKYKQSLIGNKSHKMPNIMPYKKYLVNLWQKNNVNSAKILLSAQQDLFIWQYIINNPNKAIIALLQDINLLANNKQLLTTIMSEYALVRQFLLPVAELENNFNINSNLLALFIDEYHKFLAKILAINIFDVADLILTSKIIPSNNGNIYYYGINEATPSQKNVFKQINASKLTLNNANVNINTKKFTNTDCEIREIANWAYGKHTANINNKIAIVVPNLFELKPAFVSNFDSVFNYNNSLLENSQKAYDISLGQPLSSYGLVADIINILGLCSQLNSGFIEIQLLTKVICSSYIKDANKQLHTRANIAYKLNNNGNYNISIDAFKKIISTDIMLVEIISNLLLISITNKHNYSNFTAMITKILTICGWCNDNHLSSSEYQIFIKFQDSQLVFNSLDIINIELTFNNALFAFKKLLQQTIFQPQSGDANIYILGQLEAQGLFFDDVWVMGLDDKFLPGGLRKFMFIDYRLAINYNLPDNNYQQLQKTANKTLINLKNIASNVCLSYAVNDERLPSPLIDFTDIVNNNIILNNKVINLEQIDDFNAPELTNKDSKNGVKVLSNQAKCAFRGFSVRLNIADNIEPYIGLNYMDKGKLLHKVLENIWTDIKTYDNLKTNFNNIDTIISEHITAVITDNIFSQIEKNRLFGIIKEFLTLEIKRDGFKIIALEDRKQVNVGGLIFNIRLDRIDEDNNSKKIIFDYKSGKVNLSNLGIDRYGDFNKIISDAQLAIYAINSTVDGVAFISLKPDNIKYSGFVNDDNLSFITKKNTNTQYWQDIKQYWQKKLEATSIDFQQGIAGVLPTKDACNYCQLAGLCRVESL